MKKLPRELGSTVSVLDVLTDHPEKVLKSLVTEPAR